MHDRSRVTSGVPTSRGRPTALVGSKTGRERQQGVRVADPPSGLSQVVDSVRLVNLTRP